MATDEEKRRLRNLSQQKRRLANKEARNEWARNWREKNKEKINAKKREPEIRKKLQKGVERWRIENREAYLSNLREYRQKNKLKVYARNLVYKHVRRGKMIRPDKCEQCGDSNGRVHAHHEDYSLPLQVQWLCKPCHMRTHGKLMGDQA